MSIEDDIYDLEAHFKRKANKDLKGAFDRVLTAFSELERYHMGTVSVIKSIATIFNVFGVARIEEEVEEEKADA